MAKRKRNRSRRARAVRPKTTALKHMRRMLEDIGDVMDADNPLRPQTRADCRNGPRPCPWAGCKHHLYLEINPNTGSIRLNFPDLEPWDLKETCSLDIAERGGTTLEEIGLITNLTRERIRQIETSGLRTMKLSGRRLSGDDD